MWVAARENEGDCIMIRKWVLLVGVVALLGVCVPAGAVSVSYTVDPVPAVRFPGPFTPTGASPWGANGYPGDLVGLTGYDEGSLVDLPVGPVGTHKTYIQKINTLTWTVDYTYGGTDTWDPWPDILQTVPAVRNMTIDGAPADALNQSGLLRNNWHHDYLSMLAGSTTSFLVSAGGVEYRVDVTPQSLPEVREYRFQTPEATRDVMAKFDVTVVPEPVTMLGVFLGVSGLAGYLRRRRLA
jgi:hypothetical protein